MAQLDGGESSLLNLLMTGDYPRFRHNNRFITDCGSSNKYMVLNEKLTRTVIRLLALDIFE